MMMGLIGHLFIFSFKLTFTVHLFVVKFYNSNDYLIKKEYRYLILRVLNRNNTPNEKNNNLY